MVKLWKVVSSITALLILWWLIAIADNKYKCSTCDRHVDAVKR